MPCDFLTVERYDKIVLAKVTKDRLLDPVSINALADELNSLVDKHMHISLILELSEVGFLSSAMLGKLVAVYKNVIKLSKGRMAITGVKPSIMPLFKITQLDKMMQFAPDAQEVILLYKRKPL